MTTGTTPHHDRSIEQVLRCYSLVDSGDVPALVDLFTDDVTYHRPGYQPIVGRDAFERFYRAVRMIREGEHIVDTLLADDAKVAVHGRFHGVLHDGKDVDLRFADFFVVEDDGRISRRDTFFFAPLV
ncbi:nuclear transport factor 2 family protein [Micromonospora sp. 15K316]|uniref:nuclear transport factor 2 family protein n=1 Tax=Micromonospora sp. 15K316 TaxID=2530376 RepID=UPI001FB78038|nr:nuclear transport factor 2 family protein [Micromonospora sp. 15K316]